jgi:hypothetical protein
VVCASLCELVTGLSIVSKALHVMTQTV